MREIEVNHLTLIEFEKKFKTFQVKVYEVARVLDKDREVPKIIEQTVPMMIHF